MIWLRTNWLSGGGVCLESRYSLSKWENSLMTHGITNEDCMKLMIHCPEYCGYFVVRKFSLFWGTVLCVTKRMSCIRSLEWESPQPCAQSSGMPCGTVPCLAGWERGNLFSVRESDFPSLLLLSFHPMLCVVFCYSLSCTHLRVPRSRKPLPAVNQEFSCCLSGPGKIPGNRLSIGLDSGLPGWRPPRPSGS